MATLLISLSSFHCVSTIPDDAYNETDALSCLLLDDTFNHCVIDRLTRVFFDASMLVQCLDWMTL